MATIDFGKAAYEIDERFQPLGVEPSEISPGQKTSLLKKIQRKTTNSVHSHWATIGWADNRPFAPTGTISFSKNGQNTGATAVTLEEIKNIYEINPRARGSKFVNERYINFDAVDFGLDKKEYTIDELPELRLTLFLQPDEGAVVFYQGCDRGKWNDPDADVEYILPQSTGPDHTTKRDRLDYLFPIIPNRKIKNADRNPEIIEILDGKPEMSFVVKVLTFKRNQLNPEDLVHEGLNILKKNHENINERYDLLIYNPKANNFETAVGTNKIDLSKKTLLLVHGTFVRTPQSYGGLYLEEYAPENMLLKQLIDDRVYDQIIAFDHPTILEDAKQNAEQLYKYLGSNSFQYPVDLIGTSRGALVCHYLAMDKNNRNFECGKVLSISGGFGVGYFKTAKRISTLLKVLRKGVPGWGTLLTMIAQFSIDFFISRPGCQLLTPNNERLLQIINSKPTSALTVYQNVQADWHKSLVDGFFKKTGMVIVDAVAKSMLGRKHDLVVGFDQQGISPANQSRPKIKIRSMHTKNLVHGYPKEDVHQIVRDFLDD